MIDESSIIESGPWRLVPRVCAVCGVRFAIDADYWVESLIDQRGGAVLEGEETRGWYVCPNGHAQREPFSMQRMMYEKLVATTQKCERLELRCEQLTALAEMAASRIPAGSPATNHKE